MRGYVSILLWTLIFLLGSRSVAVAEDGAAALPIPDQYANLDRYALGG